MSRLVPLRIRIGLASPIAVGPHPLHLDALLTHQAAARARGASGLGHSRSWTPPDIDLPLAREGRDPWVWRASAAILVRSRPGQPVPRLPRRLRRGFAQPADLVYAPEGVRGGAPVGPLTAAGDMRPEITLIHLALAPAVVFYAVGDPREVLRLLQGLTGLGRGAARGLGAIRTRKDGSPDIEIARAERDWSLARDGAPMRVLPEEIARRVGAAGRGAAPLQPLAYRPPYWLAQEPRIALCRAPLPTALEEDPL